MKMKLLLLLGLIVGSLGVSAFFSGNAFAADEVYRWENDNTIIGSGGNYNNKIQRSSNTGTTTRAVPVETVTFTRVGTSAVYKAPTNIFYTVQTGPTSGGSRTCNLQLAITVSSTNVTTGNLKVNDTGVEQCTDSGLSTTTSITGTGPDPASFAGGGEAADGASEEVVNTCDVDGVGWIICPVMNFIGMITDHAYTAVQALLTTQPLTFNAELNPTRDAWTIMRNFANIVFVIFFLFVIFSQLTSFGISNYGIKKILPRLIVVAILVNASYIICALAVDLSNILGVSLKGLFDNISQNYNVSLDNQDAQGIFNGQNMFANIIGAVLATGGALAITTMAGLSILLPIMITALVAIVTVVAVLTLRQALLIILIVISPLAFVAFLLPNTEDWFKKWRKLFTTLLLMYPIIAVIFGASAFAGTIIMNSADGPNRVLIQIMGAGVTIIPLFITPIVMRTAGTFLNRFGGGINNPNKGPFDRMRKGAENVRKRQEGRRAIRSFDPNKRTMAFGKFSRAAKRSRIESGIESEKKRAEAKYLANETIGNESFRNKAAGGLNYSGPDASHDATERARTSAQDILTQIEISEVKAASAQIDNVGIPPDMIQAIALGKNNYTDSSGKNIEVDPSLGDSPALRLAAIQKMVATGMPDKITEMVEQYSGDGKTEESKTLADALASSGSRPGWIGQSAISKIRQGEFKEKDGLNATQQMQEAAVMSNAYSPDKMANADPDELKDMATFINSSASNKIPTEYKEKLVKNAQAALSDPILSTKLAKRASNVEAIALKQNGVDAGPATRDWRNTTATVANPQPTVTTAVPQPQTSAPTVLNIPHAPSSATPANSRTSMPPNAGSMNQQRPSGLWVEPKDRQ